GGWNPIQRYWKEPTAENRAALRNFLTPEATKWQYIHDVQDASLVAPESYTLDSALLARPGNDEIQLDLCAGPCGHAWANEIVVKSAPASPCSKRSARTRSARA